MSNHCHPRTRSLLLVSLTFSWCPSCPGSRPSELESSNPPENISNHHVQLSIANVRCLSFSFSLLWFPGPFSSLNPWEKVLASKLITCRELWMRVGSRTKLALKFNDPFFIIGFAWLANFFLFRFPGPPVFCRCFLYSSFRFRLLHFHDCIRLVFYTPTK